MSTKTHYFRIGIFVISATAIAVVAIIALGAGTLFREKIMMETYIDESVQGLEVGSPVKYRGVQIGNVEEITFVPQEYTLDPSDPAFFDYAEYVLVKMAMYPDVFKGRGPEEIRDVLENAIAAGLSVKLSSQGLTGVQVLEAEYVDPDKYPPLKIGWEPNTIYIPSAPSTLARLTQAVGRVLNNLEEAEVTELVSDARKAMQGIDQLARNLDRQVVPAAHDTLVQAEETLSAVEGVAAEGSPDRYELRNALRELAAAARSMRILADYLERHPESLVQGKPSSEPDRR